MRVDLPLRSSRALSAPQAEFSIASARFSERAGLALQAAPPQESKNRAEVFYLQKQIQTQTLMAIILEDGERIEGAIEWYDAKCIKVRGRQRMLVYKSAIKYMHKLNELGE